MTDIILGRPPDPIAFLGDAVSWAKTSFSDELREILMGSQPWLANLSEAEVVPVFRVDCTDFDIVAVAVNPFPGSWKREDGYALQRQEDIWHFSKMLAVEEVRDPDDFVFGWTPESQWGVLMRPADNTEEAIQDRLLLAGVPAAEVAPENNGKKLLYDVQRVIRTGAVVAVRISGDQTKKWGLSDGKPPFAISQEELTREEAAELVSMSLVSGSDGFKAMPWQT